LICGEGGECGDTTVPGYAGDCALDGELSNEGDTIAGFTLWTVYGTGPRAGVEGGPKGGLWEE
jgi:hypothetical protein